VPATLWAGTDDGLVHVTTDEGGQWRDVTPPQAKGLYVACIEASPSDPKRAYVAIDGHRSDVFTPLLVMTGDGGKTWTDLADDLPRDVR